MSHNINFHYFFNIYYFYILLEQECTINNNNFFWNNNDDLVEITNNSEDKFHEGIIHEEYSHREEHEMKKIKWKPIFIAKEYIEDYCTECKKE